MTAVAPESTRKTKRFEARLDQHTAALLADAANASGMSLTAFVVGSARERAEEVLAHHDVTMIPPDQFATMMDALNRPGRIIPGLRRIVEQPRLYERV